MADIAVGGPLAIDVFLIGGDWVPQSNSITPAEQRETAQGADGDTIASQLHGTMTSVSVTYVNVATTGNLALPKAGSITGGYHIDNCSLPLTPNGWPTLTVTGHNHADNSHATATAEFTPSVTIPAGFGVTETLSTLGSLAGMRGITYEWGCEHVDEDDGVGDHLAGSSYNGNEKITLQFTGEPTTPFDVTTYTTFDEVNSGTEENENTSHDKFEYSYEANITRD